MLNTVNRIFQLKYYITLKNREVGEKKKEKDIVLRGPSY